MTALATPRSDEKPPFQTRVEIERQTGGGPDGWTGRRGLGGAVFDAAGDRAAPSPRRAECSAPLDSSAARDRCYTGACKGELLRIRVNDVDFAASHVVIREKNRVHDRRTTRRVPLSTALATILTEWLKPSRRPLPIRPSRACRAEQEAESDHRAFVEGSARRDEGAAR